MPIVNSERSDRWNMVWVSLMWVYVNQMLYVGRSSDWNPLFINAGHRHLFWSRSKRDRRFDAFCDGAATERYASD